MDKIFPYNEEVEQMFNKAKKLFNLSMNGIASEAMSSLGYKLNFGVVLPRIKEISADFEPNALLATRAWWSGCREMMIFATLILPKNMNQYMFGKEQMKEWEKQLFNPELCEQFSKNFLSKIQYKKENGEENGFELSTTISKDLIERRNSDFSVFLGYINYANLLMQNRGKELEDEVSILKTAMQDLQSDSFLIYSSVTRYLRIKARQNPKEGEHLVQQIKKLKGKGINYSIENIEAELF